MRLSHISSDFELALQESVRLYRAGELAEARALVGDLLCERGKLGSEQLVRASIQDSIISRAEKKYEESLKTLRAVGSLVRSCDTHVQAKYHNALGRTHYLLKNYDAAFDAFTAASVLYEMAGDIKMVWGVENNIALILIDMHKLDEAYEHINAASANCGDPFLLAQINDTHAAAKLIEGTKNNDINALMQALDYAMSAMSYFRQAGETAQIEATSKTLRQVCEQIETYHEAARISYALERAGGRVSRAAEILGVHHKTLSEKLKCKKFSHIKHGRQPERRPRGKSAAKVLA